MAECLVYVTMSGQSVRDICGNNFISGIITTAGFTLRAIEYIIMAIVNCIDRQFFICGYSVVWRHSRLDCCPLSRLVVTLALSICLRAAQCSPYGRQEVM